MKFTFIILATCIVLGCVDRKNSNDKREIFSDSSSTIETLSGVNTQQVDTTITQIDYSKLSPQEQADFDELESLGLPGSLYDTRVKDELIEKKRMELSSPFPVPKYKKRRGYSGNYTYNYDVVGVDQDGNSVSGNIDIQDKYGSGTIINANGEERSIDVEWVDWGELSGVDEDGVDYDLSVE